MLSLCVSDVVFGSSLSELCEREHCNVPRFVQECILAVENRGRMLYVCHLRHIHFTFVIEIKECNKKYIISRIVGMHKGGQCYGHCHRIFRIFLF